MRLLLGLAAFVAPTVALAQPSAAPAIPSAPPPERVAAVPAVPVAPPGAAPLQDRAAAAAAAPAPKIGIDRRVDDDAAAGRAFFSETALTGPRGHIGIELRMPTAPGANLAVRAPLTDRIELGVSALAVADEDEKILGFQAKGQIWHNDRAAVALGLQRYASTSEFSDEGVTIPTLVATSCLDGADCVAIVSLSLNGIIVDGESDVPVFVGASWALGRKVQFVGEIHLSNDDTDSMTFGYFGLRGASRSFAVDAGVGFLSAGHTTDCFDCSSDSEAFPFIGVATRL